MKYGAHSATMISEMATAGSVRTRGASAGALVLGLVVLSAVAQYQVDHRVPGGFNSPGSVRYVQRSGMALPSEARYERRAAGYLPSENRIRYLDQGPGQSFARVNEPLPGYKTPTPYDQRSSLRYGTKYSTNQWTMPPGTPMAGVRATTPNVHTPPGTIRYGNQLPTIYPSTGGSSLMRPIAGAPSNLMRPVPGAKPSMYAAPGTIRYSGGMP